jgi:hypothetical protein
MSFIPSSSSSHSKAMRKVSLGELFDLTFFFGDLNYRVNIPKSKVCNLQTFLNSHMIILCYYIVYL